MGSALADRRIRRVTEAVFQRKVLRWVTCNASKLSALRVGPRLGLMGAFEQGGAIKAGSGAATPRRYPSGRLFLPSLRPA